MKTTKRMIVLLALLSFTAPAMADVWEIYSYWSVNELWVIFNSISSTMQSAGFSRLSKTTMIFTLLAVLAVTAWYMEDHLVKWIISVMCLWGLVNLPVSEIAIIDKTGTQPPKVVAHIPVFLAATASFMTMAGDWFTRSFEASFATVLDVRTANAWQTSLSFRNHDLGFGHRLIKDSQRMRIADPILQADMIYFTRDCINAGMAEGRLDFKRIYRGNEPADTWGYIVSNVNPARMTTYHDGAGNVKIGYCDEVATGTLRVAPADGLTQRLDSGIQAAMAYYGKKYNQVDVTGALFAQHLQNAYGVMLNASMGASDIIKQNMFLNLHEDSKGAIGQLMGDPSAVIAAYARAQAAATANSTYLTMSNLAERVMPRIRNLLEFIIYSIFPIMALYMLNTGHKSFPVFRAYLMALVQINLWPPLYAILNFAAHTSTADHLIANTAMSGGLSIQTMGMVSSTLISDQAVMGYAVIAIPFIAAGMTKGGEMAISGIAQTFQTPVQSASQSAGGASMGNMSQGNVSMDNANANKTDMSGSWSEPASYESQANSGWKSRFTGDGNSYLDDSGAVSKLETFSLKTSARQAYSYQQQAERAETAAVGEMRSYAETTAAGLQKMAAFEQGHGKGASSGSRDGVGWGAGGSQEAAAAMEGSRKWGNEHKLDQNQAAQIQLLAEAGGSTLGPVQIKAAAKIAGTSEAKASQLLSEAHGFNEKTGFSAKVDAATKAAHESSFDIKDESTRRGVESVRGSFDRGQQALTQASANYQQSQSYKEAETRTRENAVSIDRNANDRFRAWLAEQTDYHNPDSKLGGAGANRVLTNTDESLKLWYAEKWQAGQNRLPPLEHPDIRAAHEAGAAGIKGHNQVAVQGDAWRGDAKAAAGAAGVAPGSKVESDVPRQAAKMREESEQKIKEGRAKTEEKGAPVQREAASRTEPGSQNLAGIAATNAVAQVTPDSASEKMLKKIPGINMSVATPGAAVAEASAARAREADQQHQQDISRQILAARLKNRG